MTGTEVILTLRGMWTMPLLIATATTAPAAERQRITTANVLCLLHFRTGSASASASFLTMGGGGTTGGRKRRLLDTESDVGGRFLANLRWFGSDAAGWLPLDLELTDPADPNIAVTIISSASKRSCSSILRRTSSVSDSFIAMISVSIDALHS